MDSNYAIYMNVICVITFSSRQERNRKKDRRCMLGDYSPLFPCLSVNFKHCSKHKRSEI